MDIGNIVTTILTLLAIVVVTLAILAGIVWLLIKSIRTVPEGYQDVIFRLDRLAGSRGPGIYFKIPFLETVYRERVSIKNEQVKLPGERTPVSDGPEITSTAIVFYRVVDPGLAITRMGNYEEAVTLVSRSAFQEAFASSTLTEAQTQRPAIARKIKDILDRKTATAHREQTNTDETVLWGIIIISVEVSDVDLPDELAQQISRQAIAERELQARRTLAASEKAIAEQLAQADEIYALHPGARQLRNSNQFFDAVGSRDKIIVFAPTDQLNGATSGLGSLAALAGNAQADDHALPSGS